MALSSVTCCSSAVNLLPWTITPLQAQRHRLQLGQKQADRFTYRRRVACDTVNCHTRRDNREYTQTVLCKIQLHAMMDFILHGWLWYNSSGVSYTVYKNILWKLSSKSIYLFVKMLFKGTLSFVKILKESWRYKIRYYLVCSNFKIKILSSR